MIYTSWPSCKHEGVLAGVFPLSFAIFDLKICVDLPQNKTKRLPVAFFFLFRGGRIMAISRKTKSKFWQKLARKKKVGKNKCHRQRVDESDAIHV